MQKQTHRCFITAKQRGMNHNILLTLLINREELCHWRFHHMRMVFFFELQLWLTLHGYLKECVNIKGFIGNFSHLTLDYGQLIMFILFSALSKSTWIGCDYRILVNRRKMVGKHCSFAAEASFWPTRSWSTFCFLLFFSFPKEAKGNVANVDVAVQPALLVLSAKTKRHQILLSPVI